MKMKIYVYYLHNLMIIVFEKEITQQLQLTIGYTYGNATWKDQLTAYNGEASTDTIWYTYDTADNLISMNLSGEECYYARNAQMDIIGILDRTGTEVVNYTYDSWDKIISINGSRADTVGKTHTATEDNDMTRRQNCIISRAGIIIWSGEGF